MVHSNFPDKLPTSSFAVIYRGCVKPGQEDQYVECWKRIASYFVAERGALGSALHKTSEGIWLAYSKWPDKETRDASWPQEGESISNELPVSIQEAIKELKQCLDPDRPFPEICMELVEEIKCKNADYIA